MDVANTSPLGVGSIVWRPRMGLWALTVVCKATFVLAPGESALAHDQDPPNDADEPWNDDPRRSLREATDLAPFKRRADVLVVGHAHAPRGQPVSSLVARVVVGSVDKAVEIHADRVWIRGGQLHEGAPFARMPLVWERAAAGLDAWNPVGVRADARPDVYGQTPVPNLQPPGWKVVRQGEVIPPVGLGPISPTWPARAARLRGYAASWDHRRWNERPMPQDIDQAFFNAAPPDQQTDDLRVEERIVLANLHPEHPRLVTSLTRVAPSAVVERPGAAPQALALRCDTLTVDSDRGVCNVVWRGQVMLAQADERGRVVIAVERSAAVAAPAPTSLGTTVSMAPTATGPSLPFREGSPWSAAMPAEPPPRPPQQGESGTFVGELPKERPLPFATTPAEAPVSSSRMGGDTGTFVGEPASSSRMGGDTGTFVGQLPKERALPFATTAESAPPAERPPLEAPSFTPPQEPPAPPDTTPPVELPPPPPMIGPLATPERAEEEATPAQEAAPPEPPIAPPAPAPPALPLDAFPIERCAATAASMARRAADREKILEENELVQETWDALVKHWTAEIREETKRGKATLLEAYDRAYVARLEEERGPIRVEDYALLTVAGERGDVEAALAKLTLPRGAVMRLQRVWAGKIAADAAVGASVRVATEAARDG